MFLGVNYPGGGGLERTAYTDATSNWDFGIAPPAWNFRSLPLISSIPGRSPRRGLERLPIRFDNKRPWELNLADDLREMWSHKISAIRWFVLGSGKLFGLGREAPHFNPHSTAVSQLSSSALITPDIVSESSFWHGVFPDDNCLEGIIEDFLRMLTIVAESPTNIRIVPVILDYRFLISNDELRSYLRVATMDTAYRASDVFAFSEFINARINSAAEIPCIPGVRQYMIRTPSMRVRLLEFFHRLALATVDAGLAHRVLCWDIMNEPDAGVLDTEVRVFLREAISRIHSIDAFCNKTTIGWLRETSARAGNTGEAVPQFHAYVHNGLPSHVGRVHRVGMAGQSAEDYVGRDPAWWRVPDAMSFGSTSVPAIIGELATDLTLARIGREINPGPVTTSSERWIAHYSKKVDARGLTTIFFISPDAIILDLTDGPNGSQHTYLYDRDEDNLGNRLELLRLLHYEWVFLWEWNRPRTVPLRGSDNQPVTLPSGQVVQILPSQAVARIPAVWAGGVLVDGYLKDLRLSNIEHCMVDSHLQSTLSGRSTNSSR